MPRPADLRQLRLRSGALFSSDQGLLAAGRNARDPTRPDPTRPLALLGVTIP